MGRRRFYRRIAIALALCIGLTPSSPASQQALLDARMNEQIVMIPAGRDYQALLETTIFRPDGPGPFPLLVINHGKQAGDPHLQQRERFFHMATAFVRRGYAVMVPMRSGFAESTGRYEDHGCDIRANGYAQADDVAAAIAYARAQSWIDGERIVVAGQSYGGLAAMALSTRDIPGVRGVLNFAGGLRVDGGRCDWKGALAHAFADYGANAKVPSLWMYGANDSYFAPRLATRFYRAYTRAGGTARLVAYGPFKHDAHAMLASRDGEKIWLPETTRFLQAIGMPTEVVHVIAERPVPARTDFATVDDVDAVPFLSDGGRAAYRIFLGKLTPRAFAVSEGGAWGWAEEGEDPGQRALAACRGSSGSSGRPCRLYSVDDYVVWPRQPSSVPGAGGAG